MSFTVTTDHFTYEPASPGLGESPTYLVTPRTPSGQCIELFWESGPHVHMKKDQVGQVMTHGGWKLTEYDKDDEAVDSMYFRNFADADTHAFGILDFEGA